MAENRQSAMMESAVLFEMTQGLSGGWAVVRSEPVKEPNGRKIALSIRHMLIFIVLGNGIKNLFDTCVSPRYYQERTVDGFRSSSQRPRTAAAPPFAV